MRGHDASVMGDGRKNLPALGCELWKHLQRDAVLRVVLNDPGPGNPVDAPSLKAHGLPNAAGHQPGTPVPTELALLLANAVTPAHWIIEFLGMEIRPLRANVFHRASKANLKGVPPSAQHPLNRHPVPLEHVLRTENERAVQHHRGDGVQAIEDKVDARVAKQFRPDSEHAAVVPIRLLDPLQTKFIAPMERIGNHPMA